MNIQDIADLIQIRSYTANAINNYSLTKTTAKELNNMLVMLDKQIVEHILSDDFKAMMNFDEVDAAVKNAAFNNNIKAGMKSSVVPAVSVIGGKAHLIKPEPV